MRLLKTTLLLGFAMLSLTCKQSARPAAFFHSVGFDADSRINALGRQLGYLQTKLGIASYEFEFATPKDKKLIAKFKAELNGNLVPELSGIYHIPPTGSDQNNAGRISVNFFNPQYQTQPPQSPTWELTMSSSGRGETWTIISPFMLPVTTARSIGVSSGSHALEDDQEYNVWEMDISPVEANKSGQNAFKYTLTVSLAKVAEGEDLQKVRKEDFK